MTDILLPEWAPQRLVQLCWPSQKDYWGEHLEAAQNTHCEIIAQLSQYQSVLLLHAPDCAHSSISRLLQQAGATLSKVTLIAQANNDIWCRDYGPISVSSANGEDKASELLDFVFTGWGGKFAAEHDNAATANLVKAGFYPPLKSFDLILEGGAIDYDGNGSLLTTRACLLNPNRNPNFSQQDYQQFFAQHLGVRQIHWLEHGFLEGDDTDSHVDMLARFASENTIIYQSCDDPEDEHFDALTALAQELAELRDSQGKAYKLVALPLPAAHYDSDGERLPASYANFLISNQQVLVPTYNCAADSVALARIAACFKTRETVGINCEALIQQYGSLHCASMQIAA